MPQIQLVELSAECASIWLNPIQVEKFCKVLQDRGLRRLIAQFTVRDPESEGAYRDLC
jgi:hypothetical protein